MSAYSVSINREWEKSPFLFKPFHEGCHHLLQSISNEDSYSLTDRAIHVMVGTALFLPIINMIIYVVLRTLFPCIYLSSEDLRSLDQWANETEDRQEVKEVILQCAKEINPTLDLSEWGLTSLPDMIGRLTHVEELNLEDNQLMHLPETIKNLTNVTELNLDDNQLEALPDGITHLKALEELSARNNKLGALPENIDHLEKLQELMLSGNRLKAIPETINKLRNLKNLYLDENELTELPDTFFDLPRNSVVSIENNRFSIDCTRGILNRANSELILHCSIGETESDSSEDSESSSEEEKKEVESITEIAIDDQSDSQEVTVDEERPLRIVTFWTQTLHY